MSEYVVDSSELTSIANAIRTKGGTSAQLAFPSGFVSAIEDISSGGITIDELATNAKPSGAITVTVASTGSWAFAGKAQITSAALPNATSLGASTFSGCTGLTSVSIPNVTSIGGYAFSGCSSLTSISVPHVKSLGNYAFNNCTGFTSLTFPKVVSQSQYPFAGCTNLAYLSCPVLMLNGTKFYPSGATNLAEAHFPSLVRINADQFIEGSKLVTLVFPAFSGSVYSNSLRSNTILEAIDFNACTSFGATAFNGCSKLATIVVRGSSVPTLTISAFNGTPFASGGTGGTLYVPNAMIASYQANTNWSTVLAYTNNQIKSIESTATDQDAPIDLNTHYIDGTSIMTPTSSSTAMSSNTICLNGTISGKVDWRSTGYVAVPSGATHVRWTNYSTNTGFRAGLPTSNTQTTQVDMMAGGDAITVSKNATSEKYYLNGASYVYISRSGTDTGAIDIIFSN